MICSRIANLIAYQYVLVTTDLHAMAHAKSEKKSVYTNMVKVILLLKSIEETLALVSTAYCHFSTVMSVRRAEYESFKDATSA